MATITAISPDFLVDTTRTPMVADGITAMVTLGISAAMVATTVYRSPGATEHHPHVMVATTASADVAVHHIITRTDAQSCAGQGLPMPPIACLLAELRFANLSPSHAQDV